MTFSVINCFTIGFRHNKKMNPSMKKHRHQSQFDHRKLQVINVSNLGKVNSFWADKLYSFCEKYAHKKIEPKWENYTPVSLDLENHLTFDILSIDGEILSFCGIYNGGRYPNGVYRILNRAFINPKYRSPGMSLRLLNSRYLVPGQLLQHQHQIDFAFLSLQELNLKRVLPKIVAQINTGNNWQWFFPDELYQVAPFEIQPCYQHIGFSLLSDRYQSVPFSKISHADYLNLPKSLYTDAMGNISS